MHHGYQGSCSNRGRADEGITGMTESGAEKKYKASDGEGQLPALRIKNVTLQDNAIKRIYFEAFSKKDRMPYPLMVAMSKLPNTQFQAFYDRDIPCGFTYYAVVGKIIFVMFFAVDTKLRSRGYGSAILQEIKKAYPEKKIVISIEPCDKGTDDFQLREKRKAFYLKNGYRETGYRMRLNNTEQEIIITNGEFNKKEFRLFFVAYSNGTVWPKIWKRDEAITESGGVLHNV